MEHAWETVEATSIGSAFRREPETAATAREAKRDETPFREPDHGPESPYVPGESE